MLRGNLLNQNKTNMSQSVCQNCSSAITCGCQRRTASDGKSVCSNCVALYEKKLQELKASKAQKQ